MNAKFEEWLHDNLPWCDQTIQALWTNPGIASAVLRAFVREVGAKALRESGYFSLDEPFYAAMRKLLKEWGIEE